MTEDDKKPLLRIGIFTSFFMISLALVYDGLQALIELVTFGLLGWLINPIITIWSILTFTLWFKLKGINFVRPGKALTMGGAAVVEFIPFLSDLPTWTGAVAILIAQSYAEDVIAKLSPENAQALGKALGKLNKKGEGDKKETEKTTTPSQRAERVSQKEPQTINSRPTDIREETATKEVPTSQKNKGEENPKEMPSARPRPVVGQETSPNSNPKNSGLWFEKPTGSDYYSEFDSKTGTLVPPQDESGESDDWPIAA